MNTEELARKLVSWIQRTVLNAGCNGVVLGMSGGIDSSVLAVLCKRAFPENTLGIIMPCYSSGDDEMYARMVSDKFNVRAVKVSLDPVFDAFLQAASADRLRDNILALANKLKCLVAGSGDRSELTVGYFTKYGDGGVDFLPLGNLLKTQVRELGSYLEVPEVIVAKPPTPGLWPGQTGEGELGITYEALDRYVLTGKASPEVESRIKSMNSGSEHKRRMPPLPDF